ncbi:MAG TPA: HAD hydrolase-like protein, partial [Saprospiraceae bacterium]|nr:HAD hydrolase-like protein [Saprospiraceae bacterium]
IDTFVIDGDATLWPCGVYYFEAERKFSELLAQVTGLDTTFCHHMLDTIDGGMLNLPGAFSRDRFPTAFRAAAHALHAIAGLPSNESIANTAFDIGNSVFYERYPIYSGVMNALTELQARGAKLILNTKGDEKVQWSKVHNNQLRPRFEHVSVTPTKDAPYYERLVAKHDLVIERTMFVGDSMRDDIIAPKRLGAHTCFVSSKSPEEWKPKWSYEAKIDGPIEPTFWIKTFPEITGLPINIGRSTLHL